MADPTVVFEDWYREVHADLASSLLVAFGDVELAKEAADEAIARAYERWARVSVMASPSGWTYRVAVNVARRRCRRRNLEDLITRRQRPQPPVPGPAGELWLLVEQLPERQRLAVAFRHVAGMTEVEVGRAMGISRGTVSATLRQAYQNLRRQLDTPAIEETTR